MVGAPRIRYLGWSGFLLAWPDLAIAIDPHWSTWDPRPDPPWELPRLQRILVSHCHHDHVGDVGRLMDLHPGARLSADPEILAWAGARWDLARRTDALVAERPVDLAGLTVTALEGTHVGEGMGPQARSFARYVRRRPRSALKLASAALLDRRPRRVWSLLVEHAGTSVLHAAETLHRGTDLPRWRVQAARSHPDALLLGVEPGEEEAALGAAAEAGAARVFAFPPHLPTRRHFRLDPGGQAIDWAAVERRAVRLSDGEWLDLGRTPR